MLVLQLRAQRFGVCGRGCSRHPPLRSVGAQQPVLGEHVQQAGQQPPMSRQDPQPLDELVHIERLVYLQRRTQRLEGLQRVLASQLVHLVQQRGIIRSSARLFGQRSCPAEGSCTELGGGRQEHGRQDPG